MTRRTSRTLPLFLCALLANACGNDNGTEVQELATVSVTPATATLVSFGATEQLSASARDASGNAVAGSTFGWTSSAPAVATVSAAGLVTAVSNGTATITAAVTGGTLSGTAAITVAQAAATISLVLADDTLTAGGTTQATAEAQDAGGTALAAPDFSWSSSDPAVATVDDAGLVTGVSDGEAVISASQDGSSGNATLVVVRPSLALQGDTILGGAVVVKDLTVPAGVTVTLSADLEISATGAVAIEGSVMGDCVAVNIQSEGSVAISGTVNNACATQALAGETAPALTIESPGGVDLTDATIVSSGPVTVASEPSAAFLASAAGGGAARALAPLAGTVSLEGAEILGEPSEVPQPESAEDGPPHGADFEFRALVDLILNGTNIEPQDGGPGVPVSQESATDLTVNAGAGGHGGDIVISLPQGGTIRFRTTRGAVTLQPGDGGPGGPATATTTENPGVDPAPRAEAYGASGGKGGSTTIFGAATLQEGSDLNLIRWQVGRGGRGGNATALAARGVDATSTRFAQVGGQAIAIAGDGGAAGVTEGGFLGQPEADGKQGGGGGIARATGGDGGNGFVVLPDGALGGAATASGGLGGNSTNAGGREGGDGIAAGGNGGMGADVCPAFSDNTLLGQISVASDPASSDQYIFNAGSGTGLGLVYRVLSSVSGAGGDGGGGALLSARGGVGGVGRSVRVASGVAALGAGGNGGDGGKGAPGGTGGAAGGVGEDSDPGALESGPLFVDGDNGGGCGSLVEGLTLVATGAAAADQTIQINGSGAWVNVTGTLSDDGSVVASGRGTVAGFPNIDVSFAGTWDSDTQTLSGTYTIDAEKQITAGHPVVYNVNVSGG